MAAQRIQIVYPHDAPMQDFHCPACGALILNARDSALTANCEHVDFLYIEELGEFEHLRAELRDHLRARGISTVGIDPADGEDIIEALASAKDEATAAIFYLTTVGMSCCRSVAVTVVAGIDFFRAPRP